MEADKGAHPSVRELPPASFGPAGDTWVVDVTDWDGAVDPVLIRRIGRPVLVCFGGHAVCPLGAGAGHGIVIEVAAGRRGDLLFADRFQKLMRADVPLTVRTRDNEDRVTVRPSRKER